MNYIYTLIPIALIGFAAVQGSKWNFNAATYMDKKYTNAVKGMMCVVIMYVHISNDYTNTVQNINLTLCQGLLPNMNISVIGVSWTLAVIFVFYLLFPFFCFLLENKKRAWLAFICAAIYNFVCSTYFFDESHIADRAAVNFSARTNILYCAVYFIAGGLIFLYRKELADFASKYKVFAGAILLIATVAYFAVGGNTLTMLFFCVVALIYTLGCRTGGYWSIQLSSSSAVSVLRFTCATW